MRVGFITLICLSACGIALAGGCAYRGYDDPVSRKLTWFSYLNGDDLRRTCAPSQPPRYRFVYNGIYAQQVRTYDVGVAAGSAFEIKVRVIGPTNVGELVIADPVSALSADPLALLGPGRGQIEREPLRTADIDDLDRALAESGFFQPAPEGLRLSSEDFFWIGVACIDGRIIFNAYRWPDPGFAKTAFANLLLSWDPTGVPINPPRSASMFDTYGEGRRDEAPRFDLLIGSNGLAGTGTLF